MSVVIVGGNERMIARYKDICKYFGYKPKVFAKMTTDFKKKIGTPDLVILFTDTVSHKLVNSAVQEAERCNSCVSRCHSSSSCALKKALESHHFENRNCDLCQ